MRWLLHNNLTPTVADALQRHGHQTQTSEEIGLPPDSPPHEVLSAAKTKQLDIITADPALAAAPYDLHLKFNRSIVLLQTPDDVEQDDAIDRLFTRYKRLTPGRLYTITESRVKVRQLPTT